MKGTSALKAALAISLAPGMASANLLIDDGSDHYLGSPVTQSVYLTNGSEVHLGNGAVITGDGTNPQGYGARAALASEVPSINNFYIGGNAQVNSGLELNAISRSYRGALSIGDSATINGNVFGVGFSNGDFLRTTVSGDAVINGNLQSDGLISLSGNARITGNLREANGGISLLMDGGSIGGNVFTSSLVDHNVYLTGGTIEGAISGNASSLDFSLRDGTINGRYGVNSTAQHVEVHGGSIGGGMTFGSFADYNGHSSASLFGGSIDAGAGGWLFDFTTGYDLTGVTSLNCSGNSSVFNIWGGQFGYSNAGNGLHLDLCATVDVYGTNLTYSGGLLSGTLADGSAINLSVTEESRWGGALRLHDVSVPEPGTLGLFAAALGLAGFIRRRRPTVS